MDFVEGNCHKSVCFEAKQPMGRGDSVHKVQLDFQGPLLMAITPKFSRNTRESTPVVLNWLCLYLVKGNNSEGRN